MRIVFTIPAELGANWVFQVAEDTTRLDYLAGVRKLMAVRVALLLTSLFPIYVVLWGWAPAIQQLVFSLVLSLMLIEVLLINFRKIPFACSYQPGKSNMTVLGIVYGLAFMIYAYIMATLEVWLMHDDAQWLGFLLLLTAVLAGIVA
jgi:hypothetical protein